MDADISSAGLLNVASLNEWTACVGGSKQRESEIEERKIGKEKVGTMWCGGQHMQASVYYNFVLRFVS